MSEIEPKSTKPVSEDRRRPRSPVPYVAIWCIAVVCVIFAIVAMLNQA